MYRITGLITGLAPLLFNAVIPGELEPPGPDEPRKNSRPTKEQRIEKAMKRVNRNKQGIFIPGWNLKQCLLAGCKKAGLKEGRSSLEPFLRASIFADRELTFGKKDVDFLHEHWGRIPPRIGPAVLLRRPAMNEGWKLPFGLNVVDDRVRPGDIKQSLEEAGLLVGLGAWRPEYGRFMVTDWKVEKGKA